MDDSMALTEAALAEIVLAVDRAETPEDFFVEADEIVKDPRNLLPLPVDLGAAEPLVLSGESTRRDVDNAPRVYEYLGALDPSNAADGRLWTSLALTTYRDYMSRRWSLAGRRNWKGRLKDRWVMQSPSRERLVRHGIARLWWVASLTFDPHRESPLSAIENDPFAYTRTAFQLEDVIVGLFERELGSLNTVSRAVLDAIHGHQLNGNAVKGLMKELTLMYGYRDLEVLSASEVGELVDSFISDDLRSRAA